MRYARIAAVFLIAGSLGACAYSGGPKEGWGTVIGAGTGALIGSQFGSGAGKLAAVGAGALIGGVVGNETGRSLDRADSAYYYRQPQPQPSYGGYYGPPAYSQPPAYGYGGGYGYGYSQPPAYGYGRGYYGRY